MLVYSVILLLAGAALIQGAPDSAAPVKIIDEMQRTLVDLQNVYTNGTYCRKLLHDFDLVFELGYSLGGFASNFASNITSDISQYGECVKASIWTNVYCFTSAISNVTQDVLYAELDIANDLVSIGSTLASIPKDFKLCFSSAAEQFDKFLKVLHELA